MTTLCSTMAAHHYLVTRFRLYEDHELRETTRKSESVESGYSRLCVCNSPSIGMTIISKHSYLFSSTMKVTWIKISFTGTSIFLVTDPFLDALTLKISFASNERSVVVSLFALPYFFMKIFWIYLSAKIKYRYHWWQVHLLLIEQKKQRFTPLVMYQEKTLYFWWVVWMTERKLNLFLQNKNVWISLILVWFCERRLTTTPRRLVI